MTVATSATVGLVTGSMHNAAKLAITVDYTKWGLLRDGYAHTQSIAHMVNGDHCTAIQETAEGRCRAA